MKYLINTCSNIIELSFYEGSNISGEPLGKEKIRGSILSTIIQILNKYSYSLESLDNFWPRLTTEIFIRLLMSHHLENGNKRMALIFLKCLLWEMGYYFKFTKNMGIVEELVEKLQNKPNYIKYPIFNEIKEWIITNTTIRQSKVGNPLTQSDTKIFSKYMRKLAMC